MELNTGCDEEPPGMAGPVPLEESECVVANSSPARAETLTRMCVISRLLPGRGHRRTRGTSSQRRAGGSSVLPEADRRDHAGNLVGLPRLAVVFRDMDLFAETDDDTTAGSIEVSGVDVVWEPFRQTLLTTDERRPEPCPVHGATFV